MIDFIIIIDLTTALQTPYNALHHLYHLRPQCKNQNKYNTLQPYRHKNARLCNKQHWKITHPAGIIRSMTTRHFRIDDRGLRRLEDTLYILARESLPYAVRNTLKDLSVKTQQIAKRDLSDRMTIRNKFSQRSIRFDNSRATGRDIDNMETRAGSDAAYMARLETGGTQHATGAHGKPIYTAQAAGQGDTQAPIKKLPMAANTMRRIKLDGSKHKSRTAKQKRFFIAVQAIQDGNKHVMIDANGTTKGIYRITGRMESTKSWKVKNLKMKLIWALNHKSTYNKPERWLEAARREALKQRPEIYRKRLQEQLERLSR